MRAPASAGSSDAAFSLQNDVKSQDAGRWNSESVRERHGKGNIDLQQRARLRKYTEIQFRIEIGEVLEECPPSRQC